MKTSCKLCKYEELSSTSFPCEECNGVEYFIFNCQDKIDKAIDKLKSAQKLTDVEVAHKNADDVLCELLNELEYENVVEEYKKIRKWYG